MATGPVEQRNQDATCYVGNLDEQLTEELRWEMMLQAGPVSNVHLPRDKVTGSHQGYGFVEFRSEEDADYAPETITITRTRPESPQPERQPKPYRSVADDEAVRAATQACFPTRNDWTRAEVQAARDEARGEEAAGRIDGARRVLATLRALNRELAPVVSFSQVLDLGHGA